MDETNPMESTDVETVFTESLTLATESTDSSIPDESVPETTSETVPDTTVEVVDPTIVTYPEDLESTSATVFLDPFGSEYQEETEATEEAVIVDVIETVGSDIAHASLFSGFLVSGTLVGIFLLRKIYGT